MISPWLRVAWRKNGYLGLPTDSGLFIRDISRPLRTRIHLQICRTTAGHVLQGIFYVMLSMEFIWERLSLTLVRNVINHQRDITYERLQGGFFWKNRIFALQDTDRICPAKPWFCPASRSWVRTPLETSYWTRASAPLGHGTSQDRNRTDRGYQEVRNCRE